MLAGRPNRMQVKRIKPLHPDCGPVFGAVSSSIRWNSLLTFLLYSFKILRLSMGKLITFTTILLKKGIFLDRKIIYVVVPQD